MQRGDGAGEKVHATTFQREGKKLPRRVRKSWSRRPSGTGFTSEEGDRPSFTSLGTPATTTEKRKKDRRTAYLRSARELTESCQKASKMNRRRGGLGQRIGSFTAEKGRG